MLYAYLAVKKVLAKTKPSAADTTVITMVDWFALSILPQFANIAVIVGGNFAAVDAHIRSLLWCSTEHTQHVSRFPPN